MQVVTSVIHFGKTCFIADIGLYGLKIGDGRCLCAKACVRVLFEIFPVFDARCTGMGAGRSQCILELSKIMQEHVIAV